MKGADPGNWCWIGISDVEGAWKWTDGAQVAWTSWNYGEPAGGAPHDCVFVNENGGKWSTRSCSSEFYFICKVPKDW